MPVYGVSCCNICNVIWQSKSHTLREMFRSLTWQNLSICVRPNFRHFNASFLSICKYWVMVLPITTKFNIFEEFIYCHYLTIIFDCGYHISFINHGMWLSSHKNFPNASKMIIRKQILEMFKFFYKCFKKLCLLGLILLGNISDLFKINPAWKSYNFSFNISIKVS